MPHITGGDAIVLSVPGRFASNGFPKSVFVWLGCFGLNLIIPLIYGLPLVTPIGAVGLTLAVVFSAAFGFMYFVTYGWVRWPALLGGVVMALTQFWPLLQIGAGMIGLSLANTLVASSSAPDPYQGNLGLLGGFYATFVTGQVLILISLIFGWVLLKSGQFLRGTSRALANRSQLV